jgi:hypothetical protein
MQIPQHKENDHGQRTAKKEQGSKETQKETDTGNLTFALSGTSDASGVSCELSSFVRQLIGFETQTASRVCLTCGRYRNRCAASMGVTMFIKDELGSAAPDDGRFGHVSRQGVRVKYDSIYGFMTGNKCIP